MQFSPEMKVVVVGLGVSGISAVKYLYQQGLEVYVSERRPQAELQPEERALLKQCCQGAETGGHTADFCAAADLVVVSPGVPLEIAALVAARSQGIPVVGELALAAEHFEVPVIAVTGSNGKTTVTSLISHLLKTAGEKVFVGGNIGTPVLEYCMHPDGYDMVVLELSSFQLESAGGFRPDVGLLLNLSPDHLDWHGSMKAYTRAKLKMFARQNGDDIAITGRETAEILIDAGMAHGKHLCFGESQDCRAFVKDGQIRLQPGFTHAGNKEVYELAATSLASPVNLLNAAAALLAVRVSGCSREDVGNGLKTYEPPEHRMAYVGTINGIRFINDSKATNVGAVIAALGGYDKNVILIAGGRDKGSDFSPLGQVIEEQVKQVVLLGEAAEDIAASFSETVPFQRAANMEEAVQMAYKAAVSSDTVLLAPACASFDMFENYGQRGQVFTDCVAGLKKRLAA
jgi:UDP-N-acetylmuramoylalanine--D-glutamate ligase